MCPKDSRSTPPSTQVRVSRRAFLQHTAFGALGAGLVSLSASPVAGEQGPNSPDPGLFETMYSLRSIRRLKPDPIPENILKKIVDAGIHAPSGGNRQDWRFILVRDPDTKQFIRDRYREAQLKGQAGRPPLSELPPERRRALKASMYLWNHMHEAPVLLLACTAKEYPGFAQFKNERANTATAHASIYPAVQNMLLACRAFGIGATLTTTHCVFEEELKQKIGVPADVEISALLPLGYPRGKLGKTTRKPVEEVLYWDRWGKKG